MDLVEASDLMNHNPDERPWVAVERSGASWTGRVRGIITRPALVLEQEDGRQFAIVLEGATAKEVAPPRKDRDA
jgi:hypothetical protein